ncbi:HPF/RaiA family ribosome-associated protein [Flavobacterium sp. NG2]|uniref:HPF/RaiA family ribosome-associated protein n=1 Tax=Flavobacterium sp. NG2 TaxID=3097547 RepID=UPI002A7FB4FA|nr:HPF/RaiA family ribosome-associated protein [Flavobacterium sp. NG2]WPR70568.1 HPF/RaiA family ribosome-associated protein [Flavobacterium sp. NG2]
MESTIQFVHAETNKTAEHVIIKKLDALTKHFDWVIRAGVIFKEEKDSHGKGKICEVTLSCPGPRIFASSNETSFEIAAAETMADIETQLNKRKSEMKTH